MQEDPRYVHDPGLADSHNSTRHSLLAPQILSVAGIACNIQASGPQPQSDAIAARPNRRLPHAGSQSTIDQANSSSHSGPARGRHTAAVLHAASQSLPAAAGTGPAAADTFRAASTAPRAATIAAARNECGRPVAVAASTHARCAACYAACTAAADAARHGTSSARTTATAAQSSTNTCPIAASTNATVTTGTTSATRTAGSTSAARAARSSASAAAAARPNAATASYAPSGKGQREIRFVAASGHTSIPTATSATSTGTTDASWSAIAFQSVTPAACADSAADSTQSPLSHTC